MSGTVQTATGPVAGSDLGMVLMHEHMSVMWPPMYLTYPELDDREARLASVTAKLRAARDGGVGTIVDMSTIELGRDPEFIRQVSAASGVRVVLTSGLYLGVPKYFEMRPTREIRDFIVREVATGIGSSGIRAGIVKAASDDRVTRMNERVLKAAAWAQQETGVTISTHSDAVAGTGALQQEILSANGADLARVVIGHSDDTDDLDYLRRIMDLGSTCGFDRFGLNEPHSFETRATIVATLAAEGYADRIVLSHDASGHLDSADPRKLAESIPDWRWTFIPESVIPRLRELGVTDDDIDAMIRRNPRRLLESPS